ncbi:MAG: Hsp20/alpha crystallin family protein [Planctomycetota bacterium]|jgi:HSP20 family molecular chaperone IbpA
MDVPVKKKSECAEVEHASDRPVYVPNVDIFDSEDGVVLVADLPGVPKEGVSLTLEQGVLTLSGKVKSDLPDGAEAVYREYEDGDFYRSFRLGQEIDGEKMEASVENGVLKLVIPRSDWAKTKKIEVK